MKDSTAGFYRRFFQYLLVGLSIIILLAISQSSLRGGFHQGPPLAGAEDEGETFTQGGPQPFIDSSTNPEGLTFTQGEPQPFSESGSTGQGQVAQPAVPTVVRGGGECINGRMHWVNTLSDGSRDVDPTANEFCEGSGTNARIVSDPAQAQVLSAQVQPTRIDECTDTDTPDTQTCNNSVGTGHKYCTWIAEGNKWSDCKIESCNDGNRAAPLCLAVMVSAGNVSSPWQCERDIAAGRATCTDNTTFCENTSSNESVIFLKRNGRCNPTLSAERDHFGCVYDQQQLEFQRFACGGQPQQPAPQQPAGQGGQVQQQQACTSNGSCSVSTPSACGQTATGVDNCGNVCTKQSAACQIAQGNTAITNNPVFNNNPVNTNTITVQNPTPQIITAQAAPVVLGNVGVGGTAYTTYTQPIQYTTLPKTGLPVLAWSALAFIPVGFRLRTFQKIKKALENHPSFIWENRKFKAGS